MWFKLLLDKNLILILFFLLWCLIEIVVLNLLCNWFLFLWIKIGILVGLIVLCEIFLFRLLIIFFNCCIVSFCVIVFLVVGIIFFLSFKFSNIWLCLVDNELLCNIIWIFLGNVKRWIKLVIYGLFFLMCFVNFVCVKFNFFIRNWYDFVFLSGDKFLCCKFLMIESFIIFFFVKLCIIVGIFFNLVFFVVWNLCLLIIILYFLFVFFNIIGCKILWILMELCNLLIVFVLKILCGWYGFGLIFFIVIFCMVFLFVFILLNSVLIFLFRFLVMCNYFFC